MGRLAKPSALKELAGNPGKRALNKREPRPLGGGPKAPVTLSLAAQPIWRRLVTSMASGVYTACDEHLLAAFCEQVALQQLAVAALAVEPPVTVGSMGQAVVSPWVRILGETASKIATMGARLGLDPVARQAIQTDTKTDDIAGEFAGLIQ